jgi:DNA-binding MarR family transcriptional regulator
VDAGQLHKVARLLREVALDATADPGQTPVSAGDIAIAEDITHHEKASVGEIAARTGLAQSLVSRTVAKLHDAGVVVTERDPHDGRRILISIAPDVRTGLFRSRARRPVEPALRSRYPDYSEATIARVVALLTELADILLRFLGHDGHGLKQRAAERGGHRDVGGVAAAADHDPALAPHVVAGIEGPPAVA